MFSLKSFALRTRVCYIGTSNSIKDEERPSTQTSLLGIKILKGISAYLWFFAIITGYCFQIEPNKTSQVVFLIISKKKKLYELNIRSKVDEFSPIEIRLPS
jgi:hypothetical protein